MEIICGRVNDVTIFGHKVVTPKLLRMLHRIEARDRNIVPTQSQIAPDYLVVGNHMLYTWVIIVLLEYDD